MKRLHRCPECLAPIEMLRPLGDYDRLVAFEAPVYLEVDEMPEDLYVQGIVRFTAELATPATMRERRDGRRGPYILPHAPRCKAQRSS